MGDASANFNYSDFACKDSCGLQNIAPRQVVALQNIRDRVGFAILVVSGCRCAKHNAETPGSDPHSSHMPAEDGFCYATDVLCTDVHKRWAIIEAALALKEIKRIEICPTWIHLSTDPFRIAEVLTCTGTFKLGG